MISTDFIDNSNMKNITTKDKDSIHKKFMDAISKPEEKAYCGVHLTSRPGKDQFGNWYSQCWTGHQLNEECKIIVVKPSGEEVEK